MPTDSAEPVVLATVPSEVLAVAIVNALQAQGIPSVAEGGLVAGFRAAAPGGVHILVRRSDLAQARTVLADLKAEPAEADWPEADDGPAV